MISSLIRDSRSLQTILILATLLVSAAYFRLPDLGVLGFYGDEETTAFPARSVAEGDGFRMPSGLPYYRATPLTVLNAVSASLIGVDQELSYRLPAAIFGVLTPLVLFLMSRGMVPPFLALAASLLLVFSEWHILTSREARMYGPYMLLFLSTGLLYLRWAEDLNFSRAVRVVGLAIVTLLMHALGVLIVLFPLVWLVLKSKNNAKLIHALTIIAFVVAFYWLVNVRMITGAYSEWANSVGQNASAALSQIESDVSVGPVFQPSLWHVLGLVGLFFGAWLGRCLTVAHTDSRPWTATLSVVLLSMCFGLFLLSGNYYAAGIAGVSLLLVQPVRSLEILSRCRWPLVLLSATGFSVALYVLVTTESTAALKEYFLFPYPYFVYFWQYSPGLTILFWAGVLWSIFPGRHSWEVNIRLFALVAISIVAGVGIASKWGGIRFLIGAYPFIVLVASYPLFKIHSYFFRQGPTTGYIGSTILIGLILGGAVQGHSFRSAIGARDLSYGESNRALTLGFEIYPDHKGAGQFVKRHAGVRDTIIVEDALQQYWYIGREVVWLRDEASNSRYMYLDSAGTLRDIYVNSKVLRSTATDSVCNDHSGTMWLVTSAETEGHRDLYLSDEQRGWLARVKRDFSPVYLGRDKTTSVFRLPCSLKD